MYVLLQPGLASSKTSCEKEEKKDEKKKKKEKKNPQAVKSLLHQCLGLKLSRSFLRPFKRLSKLYPLHPGKQPGVFTLIEPLYSALSRRHQWIAQEDICC